MYKREHAFTGFSSILRSAATTRFDRQNQPITFVYRVRDHVRSSIVESVFDRRERGSNWRKTFWVVPVETTRFARNSRRNVSGLAGRCPAWQRRGLVSPSGLDFCQSITSAPTRSRSALCLPLPSLSLTHSLSLSLSLSLSFSRPIRFPRYRSPFKLPSLSPPAHSIRLNDKRKPDSEWNRKGLKELPGWIERLVFARRCLSVSLFRLIHAVLLCPCALRSRPAFLLPSLPFGASFRRPFSGYKHETPYPSFTILLDNDTRWAEATTGCACFGARGRARGRQLATIREQRQRVATKRNSQRRR